MPRLIFAGLAGAVFLSMSGMAWAQEPTRDPLQRLFPQSAFQISAGSDVMVEGVRRYEKVSLRGTTYDLAIGVISFSAYNDGDFALEIDGMTVHPHDPKAPVTSINRLQLKIDDFPQYDQDVVCALSKVVERLDLAGAEIQFPVDAAERPDIFRLEGLAFQREGTAGQNCWLEGLVALDRARITQASGWGVGLEKMRLRTRLPLSIEAARGGAMDDAGILGAIGEIELSNTSEIPAFGVSDVSLESNFAPASLAGAVHVARSSRMLGGDMNTMLEAMQALNAVSLLKGWIGLEAPVTRIYSPGIVPKEAVTDFSRAGLTTITGRSDLSMRFDAGAVGMTGKMFLNGIADLTLRADGFLTPYEKRKLELADRRIELGVHAIPAFALSSMTIDYLDGGLEENALDLTGVPLGRYISEMGTILVSEQSKSVQPALAGALEQVSGFFRYAGQGYAMRLTLAPSVPVVVSDILMLALTDLQGLTAATGAALTKQSPSPP